MQNTLELEHYVSSPNLSPSRATANVRQPSKLPLRPCFMSLRVLGKPKSSAISLDLLSLWLGKGPDFSLDIVRLPWRAPSSAKLILKNV